MEKRLTIREIRERLMDLGHMVGRFKLERDRWTGRCMICWKKALICDAPPQLQGEAFSEQCGEKGINNDK